MVLKTSVEKQLVDNYHLCQQKSWVKLLSVADQKDASRPLWADGSSCAWWSRDLVSSGDEFDGVIGGYGFEPERNVVGERILEFGDAMKMIRCDILCNG